MAEIIFKLKRNVGAQQMKEACGSDMLRPVMSTVGLNAAKQELCCTDAHILVIYPIEVINIEYLETDQIFCLPLFIFDRKHYFGYEKAGAFRMENFVYKVDTEKGFVYCFAPEYNYADNSEALLKVPLFEGRFPNYNAVLPTQTAAVEKFGIGLHFLDKLIKATKESGVGNRCDFLNRFKITFEATLYGENRAIILDELQQEYPIKGLIMPVLLND